MISMYGPMMYSSMYGSMGAPNVMQYYQQKYGSGEIDFGSRPYAQPYPVAISPIAEPAKPDRGWISNLIHKLCH
ncbi:MAG: hypothetical protein E7Z92_04140 [Cyanobacteria bacterium SIG31]|nr:hypothetical protein [Cyanobacteria bacterium SIG31]